MIYFDNAATTLQKPEVVAQAVKESFSYIGNAGRGANDASLFTSRLIFQTRKQIAELFHMKDGEKNLAAERVIFTMNATESLNIVIKGLLQRGDHVITTAMEHNSVLRPLYEIEQQGVELTILPCEEKGTVSYEKMEAVIRNNTKAIVCTHASNVTGNGNDIAKIGALCKKYNLYFILDASQTAGNTDIDMEQNHITALVFTGHKGLYGPQGTGGIALADGVCVHPLLTGGSGVHSFDKKHPEELPTALEAGTLNGHGIAGLHAALQWIKETGIEKIHAREMALAKQFQRGIENIPGIRLYGEEEKTAAIVACNLADFDSSYVSDCLAQDYGIATRAGAHCAPLMHTYFETVEQGMVRFSFSYFNTEEEVAEAVKAMKEIAAENRGKVTAYVGAGGKTTSIMERAEKLRAEGKKVLILTTTKMMIPEKKDIFAVYTENSGNEKYTENLKEIENSEKTVNHCKIAERAFKKQVQKILEQHGYCIAGMPLPGTEKFGMLPELLMEDLLYMADEILVEADGSAHMPIKAPAEWEPVLFPYFDEVVIFMGAHAIGKPIKEVCHRLEYAKKILHCSDDKIVTKEDLQILREGGYKKPISEKYPDMKIL